MKRFYPVIAPEIRHLFCDPSLVEPVPVSSDDNTHLTAPVQFGWNYSAVEVCQLTEAQYEEVHAIKLDAVYLHLEGTGVLKFSARFMEPMFFLSSNNVSDMLVLSSTQNVPLGSAEIFGALDPTLDPNWTVSFHITGTLLSNMMINFGAIFPTLKKDTGERVELTMVGYDLVLEGKPDVLPCREDYLNIDVSGPNACGKTTVMSIIAKALKDYQFTNVVLHAAGKNTNTLERYSQLEDQPMAPEIMNQRINLVEIRNTRPAKFLKD